MKWLAAIAVLFTSVSAFAADDDVAAPRDGDPFTIGESNRLSLSCPHAFAKTEVVQRLGYLFAYWKKRFNIKSEWHGDRVFLSGSVYGIKIEAIFAIDETNVTAFASDPGWPWRGQVIGYVDRKLKKYMHPTYDEP
ncbi:MAG: hypothetical protein JNM17_31060 [Archangium sp.]|nr:hypothetical protein [Archangium sp.]